MITFEYFQPACGLQAQLDTQFNGPNFMEGLQDAGDEGTASVEWCLLSDRDPD